MSRRVVVIQCHPLEDSMIASAGERVRAGLRRAGADFRFHDLYGEGFRPELSADEHRNHLLPQVSPDIRPHADDLRWADTVVFVYPTWWSTQPAMLKGWFDRVLVAGVAWELPEGANRLKPRLRHIRRIVAVTTHGSSKLTNSLQGESGKRTLFRSVRAMCHPFARTHWIALYAIDTCGERERLDFLDRVESRIARIMR